MRSLAAFLQRNFYLCAALLVAAIVAFGFGHTIGPKLLHPPSPRPPILYVHVAICASWVVLFIVQTTLVRNYLVGWHRRIGLFGIALGSALPIVGTVTAVTMTRLNFIAGESDAPAFLVLDVYYMIAFALIFGAAVLLRPRPEYHRRLMFLATCTLTVAAFARFPGLPVGSWDVCVDALIACGVARDWIVDGSVHPVYRYVLPLLIAGQIGANSIYFTNAGWWLTTAHFLMGR
jgi:hypothetical protein